jgi:hypothetical protein
MLEHFITELSQELSLPLSLEKTRQDYYTVILNPEVHLFLKDLYPGFVCRSCIAEIPIKPELEELYILLMRANFLGQGTKGAVLAMDEHVKHILLILSVPEEINYRLFKERVEDFVNYLYYWKNKIT